MVFNVSICMENIKRELVMQASPNFEGHLHVLKYDFRNNHVSESFTHNSLPLAVENIRDRQRRENPNGLHPLSFVPWSRSAEVCLPAVRDTPKPQAESPQRPQKGVGPGKRGPGSGGLGQACYKRNQWPF